MKQCRILKQFEKDYYTILLDSGNEKWSMRTVIIPTKYKSPAGQDKFYYHIEPSTKDNRLFAKIPIRAGRYILNYHRECLKYLRVTYYGKDYIMLGFYIENLSAFTRLFKIRKRKHISADHLKKLHSGRDRYNFSMERI